MDICFRRDTEQVRRVGTLLYVKSELVASEETINNKVDFVLANMVICGNKKLLLGVIYRSSNGSEVNNRKLVDVINTVGKRHLLLTNIDWSLLDEGSSGAEFLDLVQDNYLINM